MRYCSCHSNIKFISSRHCVISSIYIFCRMFRTSDNFLDPRQFTRDPRQFTRNTRHAPIRLSRFRPDFGRRDYCFPARIIVRFAAGSRRDFGHPDFCFSARILASFAAGSRRDFGRREFRFLARILPGSQRDSCREEKSRRDSRRDRGGIPPRSRSLFYKG